MSAACNSMASMMIDSQVTRRRHPHCAIWTCDAILRIGSTSAGTFWCFPIIALPCLPLHQHASSQDLRSAGAEPPWTNDNVLANVRFCNVRREDDAVTRWIRSHWNSAADPCWRFMLARLIKSFFNPQRARHREPLTSYLQLARQPRRHCVGGAAGWYEPAASA